MVVFIISFLIICNVKCDCLRSYCAKLCKTWNAFVAWALQTDVIQVKFPIWNKLCPIQKQTCTKVCYHHLYMVSAHSVCVKFFQLKIMAWTKKDGERNRHCFTYFSSFDFNWYWLTLDSITHTIDCIVISSGFMTFYVSISVRPSRFSTQNKYTLVFDSWKITHEYELLPLQSDDDGSIGGNSSSHEQRSKENGSNLSIFHQPLNYYFFNNNSGNIT